MKKYAVLIGNSQFPDELDKENLKDLHCPENDVDGLGKVLASERGEFDVLPLKNEPSHKILRELQRKVKQAEADDLLLIYYAGHGKPNKSGILHLTTFDTVLAELESSAISINRVYEILDTAKCKKIVILLDCCFSGAAKEGFRGTIDDKLQQLNNSRGTYLITASTKEQLAYESAADGYGLFTKHLIVGLETGEADKDGDGWVSMNELYDYVQSHVVAENPAQQPTKHVKEERGGLLIMKSRCDSYDKQFESYCIDAVNNNLNFGKKLRIAVSPRNSEPKFISEGELFLSEKEIILEQKIVKNFPSNWTNDPCGILDKKPNWQDEPLVIRYKILRYAGVLARRKNKKYTGIISANVVLFCEKEKYILVHRRASTQKDYPNTLHSFGGAFIPPESHVNHADYSGIKRTALREILEETNLGIHIPKETPLIIIDEQEIQFIQITFLGVNLSSSQVEDVTGNWEGNPVKITFDELYNKMQNLNSWTPTGWVHVLMWLVLKCPGSEHNLLFNGESPQAIAIKLIEKCLSPKNL
jgi:8-oxo-dGTP pyrophosphatase MutT (NUDIX family)